MPAGNSILIKEATILAASDAALQRSDILINNGRIAAIEAHGQFDGCAVSAHVVNGRGKLVIPGLVNAHYHSHDVLSTMMVPRRITAAAEPAKIYGLHPKKGTIAIGADADIAIWEPNKTVAIDDAMVKDRSGYTRRLARSAPRCGQPRENCTTTARSPPQ